jgi:hypothetical protein
MPRAAPVTIATRWVVMRSSKGWDGSGGSRVRAALY